MRNLARDPDLLLPIVSFLFLLREFGGGLDLGSFKEGKEQKPRASFIIRVVNFMTGWIPDSPPPSPFSYFSLFHFLFSTTNPFFSLSPFFVVVLLFLSSMSISCFLCLLTVGFLLSIWFLFALQFKQDLNFRSKIPELKER